jgi:hypothetical protein
MTLDQELAEINRRLERLERSPGPVRVSANDTAGVKRIELGEITEPATGTDSFGVIIRNPAGDDVFVVTDDGMVVPAQIAKQMNPGVGQVINGTLNTWYTAWRYYFPNTIAAAIHINGQINGGAGIAAEARLQSLNSAGSTIATSATRTITADGSWYNYEWNWLHGVTLDTDEWYVVEYQVRRTSGAGNIDVADQRLAYQSGADQLGATANGF